MARPLHHALGDTRHSLETRGRFRRSPGNRASLIDLDAKYQRPIEGPLAK